MTGHGVDHRVRHLLVAARHIPPVSRLEQNEEEQPELLVENARHDFFDVVVLSGFREGFMKPAVNLDKRVDIIAFD